MAVRETNDPTDAGWLTADEAATLLPTVSRRTLIRWAERGSVPAVQLPSRRWLFRRADIEALLTPTAPPACAGGAR